MRLLSVLLLASLISAGPLPQKQGMVHHHHIHRRDDYDGLLRRDSMPAVSTTTSTSSKSSSTSKTTTSTSTTSDSDSSSDSATTSGSIASSTTSSASASSDSMPTVTSSLSSSLSLALSLLTLTTLYSYSITVPPSVATDGYIANPYVYRSLLPTNLVFIIVGGILGLILVLLIVLWFAFWLINRKRAKNEKEVYTGMRPGGGFHLSLSSFLLSDGSLSIAEKSSWGVGSNSSVLMLHRQSLALNLDTQSHHPSQGRTYRDMLGVEPPRRGSMFVSPVLEMMHGRSRLQVSLLRPESLYGLELLYANSPIDSPLGTSSTDAINVQPLEPQEKKKQRPPSQLLDDLLGDSMELPWNTKHDGR